MPFNQQVYKDIDLAFTNHPVTGDILKKTNEEAITQSVENLILTNFGERPFQPWLGSNVLGMLFENANPVTFRTMEQDITTLLTQFEPRINILELEVSGVESDENAMKMILKFSAIGLTTPATIDIILKRTA